MSAARKRAPTPMAPRRAKALPKNQRPANDNARVAQIAKVKAAALRLKADGMGELVKAARKNPAVFCQFTLRDEQTQKPIRLAPMHVEWHDILDRHRRAVIWTHTDAGKTSLISIGRVLWEIGKNPNIRILIVCEGKALGKKIIESIKRYIERSVELAMVFPHLQRGVSWTQSQITVKRDGQSKDPTIDTVGEDTKAMGARADLIVIDDFLSAANTFTEALRVKSLSFLKSTIEGRKAPLARLWFIGNAWHVSDAMHAYAREPATFAAKYPVVIPATHPVNDNAWVSRWPERWPLSRVREELANRGPVEGPRSLLCQPASANTQWFPIKDLWPALVAGDGLRLVPAISRLPVGWATFTAVDLGVKRHEAADDTAIITIALMPNGKRRILWIEAGKWHGKEIVRRALDHHRRYHSIVWVESNGAQDFLRQQLAEEPIWDPANPGQRYVVPVRAFETTGQNRTHVAFGIQSLAAEFANGAWQIPNEGAAGFDAAADNLTAIKMTNETRTMIEEILSWSPDAHTGDRLQALWIAREGSRQFGTVEVGTKPRGT